MAIGGVRNSGLSEDQTRLQNDIELARSRAESAMKDRELSGDKALGDMMAFGKQAHAGLTDALGMVGGIVGQVASIAQQIAPIAAAVCCLF